MLCYFNFLSLSFVHAACIGSNLTAEMLSYSVFLSQLAQWESQLDRSLKAL